MHRFLKIFLLTSTLTITLILFISYSFAFQNSKEDDIVITDTKTSVLIPGGVYTISDNDTDEMKTVELDSFYIDIFEVTNEKFAQFLNDVLPDVKDNWQLWVNTEKGSEFKITFENGDVGVFSVVEGYENYPVVTVSWEGAVAYAEWAGKTLPTIEQWEVAARGNSKGRFPWGDKLDTEKANYNFKKEGKEESKEDTQKDDVDEAKSKLMPVGSFSPNEFGLYDVIGNAWEWTSDDYKSGFLSFLPFIDRLNFLTEPMKVMMGGSFLTSEEEIGVSLSFPANIKARFGNVGFRCVTPADPATMKEPD